MSKKSSISLIMRGYPYFFLIIIKFPYYSTNFGNFRSVGALEVDQQIYSEKFFYLASIYLFKISNKNTRTRCEICSKLEIKTPERRLCRLGTCWMIHKRIFYQNYIYILKWWWKLVIFVCFKKLLIILEKSLFPLQWLLYSGRSSKRNHSTRNQVFHEGFLQ